MVTIVTNMYCPKVDLIGSQDGLFVTMCGDEYSITSDCFHIMQEISYHYAVYSPRQNYLRQGKKYFA